MFTIRTTDLPEDQSRVEHYLSHKIRVVSRSGLHITEALLFAHLERLTPNAGTLLVAGNRTGAIVMALRHLMPQCGIACHTLDLHHLLSMRRNLMANGLGVSCTHDHYVRCLTPAITPVASPPTATAPISLHCTSRLPANSYSTALYMASLGAVSGELVLDQLEDIHQRLLVGGVCLLACEAESRPLLKQVKSIFGKHRVLHDKGGVCCVLAHKTGTLEKPRNFTATFSASLPGKRAVELCSLPGVFSHRRPDNGGLALAEIAAGFLKPDQRLLDMGCGCGLTGILMAHQNLNTQLLFIDSHARALAATRQNLVALGMEECATLILSDSGIQHDSSLEAACDIFVGNPPYFSDYRIAELFLRTAHAALKPGGLCMTVAKNVRDLQARQQAQFGSTEVIMRRGYGIIKSNANHRNTP